MATGCRRRGLACLWAGGQSAAARGAGAHASEKGNVEVVGMESPSPLSAECVAEAGADVFAADFARGAER